jgi:hypothetical protein
MKTAIRNATTKALIGVAGLITVVSAIATGNWAVVMITAAVASGAGLLAAVADLRAVEARSEAARMGNPTYEGVEPARDAQPDIRKQMAELKARYALIESEPESGGRFRERLSAEHDPVWDRLI